MAERRMFTKKITDDDNFMSLSSSAQALYLHLSMSADDDGFCNQVNTSMFKAHASIQDLQALLEKRYVYQFENGVIVIKHWRMANALRKDRYTPTAFQEELKMLELKDNGSYTFGNLDDGCRLVAERLPDGCHSIGKDRIGKDRVGEDSVDIYSPADAEQIVSYLNEMCGTSYRANTRKTIDLIRARMNEGFTVEDFKTVIYKKAKQWKDDEKMVKFLRPVTLFGTKFESYLNEKEAGGRLDWLDEV